MTYDWDFGSIAQYRDAFAWGAAWTLGLSFAAISLGTAMGICWGIVLAQPTSRWREVQVLASAMNAVIRAIPLLILILVVHYGTSLLLGVGNLFVGCVVALAINLGAFVADVVRGALAGVPQSLKDAGLAVGMTTRQVLRRIEIPEALRALVPVLSLLYIDILKMSSLSSVVGFPELTHAGSLVSSRTFRPLEVFVTIAAVYVVIVVPLAYAQKWLEESVWIRRRN